MIGNEDYNIQDGTKEASEDLLLKEHGIETFLISPHDDHNEVNSIIKIQKKKIFIISPNFKNTLCTCHRSRSHNRNTNSVRKVIIFFGSNRRSDFEAQIFFIAVNIKKGRETKFHAKFDGAIYGNYEADQH